MGVIKKSRHLVEPEALGFIEGLPEFDWSKENLAEIRVHAKKMALDGDEIPSPRVIVKRAVATGVDKGPEVPLAIYRPALASGLHGAVLYLHGGGYVVGDAEAEGAWCKWISSETGCVVVSPDYRLAPETPHPGPVMDCYTALCWLHDHSMELAVDPERIGVYGCSAGGGLAAAVALLARDRKAVTIRLQCLLCPMLDDRTAVTTSPNPFAGEYVWRNRDNHFGWTCLLGHEPGRPGVSPYAAPARATNFADLPPTLIWVGALDLFVDECIEYAHKLVRAGVSTELRVFPGVTHGNLFVHDAPSSRLCRADVLRCIKKALC